jgi:peptidyl-prolyl cis-trans isomerase B (cyclophilin B)
LVKEIFIGAVIMLKHIFKYFLLFHLFITSLFYSQIPKPQYSIRAERADTVIGQFTIELFPLIAPLHTAYFDSLVNIEFYDSTAFHRVVPDFVVQGGDPNSKNKPRSTWGEGDTSQATINAEFSGVSHLRGIIGAARDTDINSASSQFYINVADNASLDWSYTAFGQVLTGMEIVDFIVNVPRDPNDNPIEKIEMKRY